MGLMDGFKIRSALLKHQKGDVEGAEKEYEALYNAGVIRAQYLLPYSVILLKKGGAERYAKVKVMLKKAEKAPVTSAEKRSQLFMNYAVAQMKLGEMDKALHLLEASHQKAPCGLTYQALGYMYIEAGDKEKALAYNQEALEYDDEDSVVLDNMGQVYYRLLDDKATARTYFEKAHALREKQIDTLYFLAQYDLADGKRDAAREKLETALEGSFSPLNYATPEMIRQQLAEL